MYNIIFNKYITLGVSIFGLYYFIFKFKIKAKDEEIWKILGFVASITGLLVALTQIMELGNLLVIPLSVGLFVMFALFTVNAWKMRKVPEKRVYCNIFFGIMIFLLLFAITVIILNKYGFFG